jgi:hypothetical protein
VPEERRAKAGLPFGVGVIDHENVSAIDLTVMP